MKPTGMHLGARLAVTITCLIAALLPPLFGTGVGRAGAAGADGALSGRVVDPNGLSLPGADIALQVAGTETVVGRATADAAGQYRVVVPQGSYDAVATTTTAPLRQGLLNGVTVDSDSRLMIVLTGTAGAPPRTVTFSGRLKDRHGDPVPGVGLSLSNPSPGGYVTSTTGTDGSFSFAVTPGRWTLHGYVHDSNGALAGVAVPHPSFTINLAAPLDLTADRQQDLTLPTFDLAVTVRDGSGAPVPGAAVSTGNAASQSVELFPGGAATVHWLAQGTTDAAGRAVLTGVPTASVTLSVSPPVTTGHGPTARSLPLTADTSADLVAGPPVSVRGVLRDHDGTAIAFAPVSLTGGSFTTSTTTLADGSYSLSVGPGMWSFTTSSPPSYGTGAFNFVTDPVAITGDRTQDLTVPGTVLRVHVTDPTGNEVPGATVSGQYGLSLTSPGSLFPGSGGNGYRNTSGITNPNGNTDVVAIPGSPIPLTAGPPNGSPFAGSLPQQADPSAGTVTLSLRPKVTVRGVVDRSSPNAQVSTSFYSSTDGAMETAITAADGSYELHAPTGTYDSISVNQMCCITSPSPPDRPSQWYLSGGSLQLSGDTTVDLDPPFVHVALRSYDERGSLRQPGTTTYGMNGSGWIDVPMGSGIRSQSGYFSGTAQGAFTTEATFSVFSGALWNVNQNFPASATLTAQNLSVSGDTGIALVATTAAPDPGTTATTTTSSTTTTTSTVGSQTTTTVSIPVPDVPTPRDRSGYWMSTADGEVHAFGDARDFGSPVGRLAGAAVVHLEPAPDGEGYWILDDGGRVHAFGSALGRGDVTLATLAAAEKPSSLSATPTGKGYWIFTDRGRVLAFGDAAFYGDMSKTHLNGPIVGSVATPSGHGYWLVASDGGIFSFGDAAFHGSTGQLRLNKPVMGMAPAPGGGYWLVASDGGLFAFDVPFHGSMGGARLNEPISGMVPGRDGYLMVAEDGGIFSFGDVAFHGSLGGNPPTSPVISVALVPEPLGWTTSTRSRSWSVGRCSPTVPVGTSALQCG